MKYLVLGPCAQGVFAILGFLKKHESELADLDEVSGASAGSLLAFLMTSQKPLDEIVDLFLNTDTSQMSKLNLRLFFKSFGFADPEYIRTTLVRQWGGDPTFAELPARPKLHVSAFCVTTGQTEYFSRDTHPDMRVAEAVTMSATMPLVFAARAFQGRLYVDGGLVEKYPGAPFLHKLRADVVAITVTGSRERPEIKTFKDFLLALVESCIRSAQFSHGFKEIEIDTGPFTLRDMNMCLEDKLKLFLLGYQQHGPMWSKDKYSSDESGCDDAAAHGAQQCVKQIQGGAVQRAESVLGHELAVAPDDQDDDSGVRRVHGD